MNRSGIELHLGEHSIEVHELTEQFISSYVVIPHPQYNPQTFYNDIMLMKLSSLVMDLQRVRAASGSANQMCSCGCHVQSVWLGNTGDPGKLTTYMYHSHIFFKLTLHIFQIIYLKTYVEKNKQTRIARNTECIQTPVLTDLTYLHQSH